MFACFYLLVRHHARYTCLPAGSCLGHDACSNSLCNARLARRNCKPCQGRASTSPSSPKLDAAASRWAQLEPNGPRIFIMLLSATPASPGRTITTPRRKSPVGMSPFRRSLRTGPGSRNAEQRGRVPPAASRHGAPTGRVEAESMKNRVQRTL